MTRTRVVKNNHLKTISATAAPRPRGRPRSMAAHEAILGATLALLREVGYEVFTIEGVAARAEVGKKTIYRHWSSREALIADAVKRIVNEIQIPDTGSTKGDLLALMRDAVRVYRDPDNALLMPGLIAAMARSEHIADIVRSADFSPSGVGRSGRCSIARARAAISTRRSIASSHSTCSAARSSIVCSSRAAPSMIDSHAASSISCSTASLLSLDNARRISMKVHAIQTGVVRVHNRQRAGKGRGLGRFVNTLLDPTWTESNAVYAWVIEHLEGGSSSIQARRRVPPFRDTSPMASLPSIRAPAGRAPRTGDRSAAARTRHRAERCAIGRDDAHAHRPRRRPRALSEE